MTGAEFKALQERNKSLIANQQPAWTKNFRRRGPNTLCCKHCGKRVSSNALGRAAHERACEGCK